MASVTVAALLLAESPDQTLRRDLAAAVPKWVHIPQLEDSHSVRAELSESPSGYLRGKCVLVEYNPLARNGQLHPWHPVGDAAGIFAQTPAEVETVLWLVKTQEVVGEFLYDGVYSRTTEVFNVTVIDLIDRKVVGRWLLKGVTPAEQHEEALGDEDVVFSLVPPSCWRPLNSCQSKPQPNRRTCPRRMMVDAIRFRPSIRDRDWEYRCWTWPR